MTDDNKRNWDDEAGTWDERAETRRYADRAFESVLGLSPEVIGALERARVLDFGCGTGLLTEKLAPMCHEVVAVDNAPVMIEVLGAKLTSGGLPNVNALATSIDEHSTREHAALAAPFDLIVASSVCSFLEDFPSTLRVLMSLLRPGGHFVQWDWAQAEVGDWAKGFSHAEIRAAYDSAGLDVLRVELGFVFAFEESDLPVVLGVGRRPG